MKLTLRDAEPADEALLLAWRNEPVTRSQSFSSDPVSADDHRRWFASRLGARERTRIWILLCDDQPAGQVRYDVKENGVGEVSIALDASFRGRGLSVELLRLSAPRACSELGVQEIRALVKPSNTVSLAAFSRAGFKRVADGMSGADPCAVFVWRCQPASQP